MIHTFLPDRKGPTIGFPLAGMPARVSLVCPSPTHLVFEDLALAPFSEMFPLLPIPQSELGSVLFSTPTKP